MAPFSEDALNRYRITHPYDRDLRPLFRRLHRLPHLVDVPGEDGEPMSAADLEREKEMAQMEVLKWKMTVERILASVRNLHRQRSSYERRADDTARRTAEMGVALEQEKQSLVAKRIERDRMIKCDEIAGRITARGKTRAELEEQITDMQQSLADHRASHALYQQTVQARIDTFSRITALVEESRGLKLPLEPQASIPDEGREDPAAMEVDEPAVASSGTKLSAAALPFQPTSSGAASPVGAGGSGASSSAATMRPPPPSHGVPTRPKVTTSASASGPAVPGRMSRVSSSTLPSKPSALRSSTTAGGLRAAGSLEDGELDTAEDGEVADVRTTRSSAGSRRA